MRIFIIVPLDPFEQECIATRQSEQTESDFYSILSWREEDEEC